MYMYMWLLRVVYVSATRGSEGPDLTQFKDGVANLGSKVHMYMYMYMCRNMHIVHVIDCACVSTVVFGG